MRIEINGQAPTVAQLSHPALVNYGHFTAMQVRGRRTRGLDLHLARLSAAHRELFDAEVDGDRVRALIRHAVGDEDASVRVILHETDDIIVTVRPPAEPSPTPLRLKSVLYQRPAAHIKSTGGFGQIYFGREAERAGFDDALLTGPGGVIAEGAITNIGFFADGTVVWPDLPQLHGITMQLVERVVGAGRRRIHLADLPEFDGAFLTNSHGVVAVGAVDDLALPVDPALMKPIVAAYEAVPWDEI